MDVIDRFLKYLEAELNLSPNTVGAYGRDLRSWADFATGGSPREPPTSGHGSPGKAKRDAEPLLCAGKRNPSGHSINTLCATRELASILRPI